MMSWQTCTTAIRKKTGEIIVLGLLATTSMVGGDARGADRETERLRETERERERERERGRENC